jgi:hypothetical protein
MKNFSLSIRIRELLSTLFIFSPVFLAALILITPDFAIGDDYHYFSFLFKMDLFDAFSRFKAIYSDPFTVGRKLVFFIEYPQFIFVNSIHDFYWIRFLHVFLLIIILFFLWINLRFFIDSNLYVILCCLLFFSQPSIWNLLLMSYGTSIFFGIILLLYASYLSISSDFKTFKDYGLLLFISIVGLNLYQPIWPVLFIGIFGKSIELFFRLKESKNPKTLSENSIKFYEFRLLSKRFIFLISIIFIVFISHLIRAKFLLHSPRVIQTTDLYYQLNYVINNMLPTTILPWFYFFSPGSFLVKVASFFVLGFSIFLITFYFLRKIFLLRSAGLFLNLFDYFFIIAIAFYLIPASLGMYLFTDLAIAFRRTAFSSALFWNTFLVLLYFLGIKYFCNAFGKFLLKLAIFLLVSYNLLFIYFTYISTVKIASNEWMASLCAAKKVPIFIPSEINTRVAILNKPFPSFYSGDEFQVRTFSFPSGAALLWLSYEETYHKRPNIDRWNISLISKESISEWDKAYLNCVNEYAK